MRYKTYTNIAGYGMNFSKKAVFSEPGAKPKVYKLVNERTGKTMLVGNLARSVRDEASGDTVSMIDFSSFNLPGNYYIKAGRHRSASFTISGSPYRILKKMLLKAFYLNRCGGTSRSYAGDYAHGACHSAQAVYYYNKAASADVSGGWHDSGSYGKYVYTGCVSLAYMLYAYKLFPDAFPEKGNIPDSPENMPDILSECKYELEWLLKMQARNGGVHHKVCGARISPYAVPEEDGDEQYLMPCSHEATAAFVAVMALAGGVYEKYAPEFAELCQSAAFGGWVWLCENPEYEAFENPPDVKYYTVSDEPVRNFNDVMFWAACELYSMTGEDVFRQKINELHKDVCATSFEQRAAGGFGSLAYILCKRQKDVEPERSIRLQFRIDADNLVFLAEKSGYGTARAPRDYKSASNASVAASAVTLISAYKLLKCQEYLRCAEDQFAYILGMNPTGTCYVTGLGENSAQNPHHRQSVFDDIEQPVPGLVVSGANCESSDDYARWNIPTGTPPAKCYCDNGFCYSTNESYICGNAAMLFVTAFFENEP